MNWVREPKYKPFSNRRALKEYVNEFIFKKNEHFYLNYFLMYNKLFIYVCLVY